MSKGCAGGGRDLPWFNVSKDKQLVDPLNPEEIFYNDLSPKEQEKYTKALQSFSYALFGEKTSWAPWRHVAVSYLCVLGLLVLL